MKAVMVGEAYGNSENLFHHAFVGTAGRELCRMAGEAGLTPRLIEITKDGRRFVPTELEMIQHWKKVREISAIVPTNVFNEHPPYNNLREAMFTNKKEGMNEIPPLQPGAYLRRDKFHHLERLWKELEDIKPNLIIALGNAACWAVMQQVKISKLRGVVYNSRFGKVLPTYHPSAVVHQWPLRPTVVADLRKAVTEIEFPEIRQIERWVLTRPSLAEIKQWLDEPAKEFAIDIESGRALYTDVELKHMPSSAIQILNRQISMVGFARDNSHALVIPLMTRAEPDLSYWRTKREEVEALGLIQYGLSKPVPKTFQNGMYDIRILLLYGLVPSMCRDDTMLMHHATFPELPKSLAYLGSVYGSAPAWKLMYSGGETFKRDD